MVGRAGHVGLRGLGAGGVAGAGAGAAAPVTRQVVDSFVANGTWSSPITGTAQVEGWGGGGGGIAATGGGGGGAYSRDDIEVTPIGYAVVVGARSSDDGVDTTFGGTLLVAKGGKSGTNGGTGGLASESTGATKYDGGNGLLGAGTVSGGGGAGDAGPGVDTTPGEFNGGFGTTGFSTYLGAGSGSTAEGSRHGARGACCVTYTLTADATYPRPQARTWSRDTVAGTTSRAARMPSGIVADELLLMAVGCDGAEGLDITVSGWIKLGQQINATNLCTIAVFYKTAVGGDTATVVTSATESCTIQVWRIASGGVPEMTTSAGGTTANPDPPAHTPSTGSDKYLWLAIVCGDGQVHEPSAAPTGYESWISTPPDRQQGVQLLCSEKFAEAASEDPGVYTLGSAAWCAATVSVPLV